MTTIGLLANGQSLTVELNPTVSSGGCNTVEVHVDFSDDWDGFSKSAVFFTSLNKNAIYEIVMTDGKCIVPAEVMKKECMLFIGIRGVNSNNNEVKTTSLVKYKISEGTPSGTGIPVEPTPDVYQQLLTAYEKTDNAISVERARIDNIYTLYVTPEQFGAVGDGVTNDSEAFRQAIETEKPIVCTYGKKYNCITEIVTEKTTINIIGNRCMLKNFHLKINVNSGETSWIHAYPVPNSTIQDVNFNGTDLPDYCIKTGIPIKFLNCKWNFYDIMVKSYGSYMDYMVFDNCSFKDHSGTHYAIDLAYLGDQHVFRECDFGGTGENRKFVSLSGCQSATLINCLFAGDHIIYSSNVVFIGCHMEGVSSITVGGDKTWNTILHFIDCYFWDMYTLSLAESSSFFDSCTFYISHQCIVGGRDYASYNQKNCKILCATTSDPNSYVNLDDLVNRKEFPERKTLSNPCVYQSSKGAVAQGRNWPLNTGSYTYLFFPSTNPYSIDGWNFYYTKATLTLEIASDSSIVSFAGNSDFAGYYLWCYRTSPDGTIHRAIMPMHMDRFYDYAQYMNGIPWVEVDAIPEPETSLATLKNGIYYSIDGSCNGKNCMCINTSNGIISYISNDGVAHQGSYSDASEVAY